MKQTTPFLHAVRSCPCHQSRPASPQPHSATHAGHGHPLAHEEEKLSSKSPPALGEGSPTADPATDPARAAPPQTPRRRAARQMWSRRSLSRPRPQCHREALEHSALRCYLRGVTEDEGSDRFCSLNRPPGTSASGDDNTRVPTKSQPLLSCSWSGTCAPRHGADSPQRRGRHPAAPRLRLRSPSVFLTGLAGDARAMAAGTGRLNLVRLHTVNSSRYFEIQRQKPLCKFGKRTKEELFRSLSPALALVLKSPHKPQLQ